MGFFDAVAIRKNGMSTKLFLHFSRLFPAKWCSVDDLFHKIKLKFFFVFLRFQNSKDPKNTSRAM